MHCAMLQLPFLQAVFITPQPQPTLRLGTFPLIGFVLYIPITQQWVGAMGTAGL